MQSSSAASAVYAAKHEFPVVEFTAPHIIVSSFAVPAVLTQQVTPSGQVPMAVMLSTHCPLR